jgi:TatD DNase family protein
VYQANFQRVWDLACADERLFAHSACTRSTSTSIAQSTWCNCANGWSACAATRGCAPWASLAWTITLRPGQNAPAGLFEAQLQMACDFELPALLHVRRSHAQVIATLKRYKPARAGVIHAFAGSYEEAREYIKLGFRWAWRRRDLAAGAAAAQDAGAAAAGERGAGDRCTGHGAGDVPGDAQQPGALAGHCRGAGPGDGLGCRELAQASSRNACELFGW